MQTATKPQHLDMLNGPIWNKLPRYALPVAATGILGQLFNAADIAVVGNFTGDMRTAAVAAVGANSPVIGLLLNLLSASHSARTSSSPTPSAAATARPCTAPCTPPSSRRSSAA